MQGAAPDTERDSADLAAREIAVEQSHVTRLYTQLDGMLRDARAALARTASAGTVGTPGARSERDAFMRLYAHRVRTLQSVESRLCFGRLDLTGGGGRRYIGRIGISDEERRELLVDWRAPAAEAFYQATAARPDGVLRRRQIATSGRTVTGVQDEVLDLVGFEAAGVDGEHVVVGEGALFASLDAARSSRMRDIVATIQADQDRVIRAGLAGVLVVQGGPGTGKTAVALHRTAFLLYANRERIVRSGVLLVGPSRVFLQYIDQVLPALGEAEAVVMSTPGELYPGVVATAIERPAVAVLKGDLRMARLISEAVRRRQRTITAPRPLDVDGTTIHLRPHHVREAREHARRSRAPHNVARVSFVAEILRQLVRELASARNIELDNDSRPSLMAELYDSRDVRREVNWCWAPITAERLLRDLYANPERIAEAAGAAQLSPGERQLLRRERTAPWTVSDIPLLDEAAELLGDDETTANAERSRAAGERRAEVEYARQVQRTFGGGEFASAEALAERYAGVSELDSVADRAGADRTWAYGHVVVDEAQELSSMMWRLLMRRCPSGSFTIVGDIAQTGSPAGATSWSQALRPHIPNAQWNEYELTVNYRTPEQIMALATAVLAAHPATAPIASTAPSSARVGRFEPAFTKVTSPTAVAPELADAVRAEWQFIEQGTAGTLAVLAAESAHDDAVATVTDALPVGVVSADSESTATGGVPVRVLTVAAAKGLEFDSVIVVEPADIVGETPRGVNDLYVALTRPTQRLHVLHMAPLPAGL